MPTHWKTLLTATLGVVSLSACSFDEAGFFGDGEDDTGADDESDGSTDPTGDGDGDWGTTTGDGDGDSGCAIDCGEGQCVDIDGEVFCECPEGTEWSPYGCAPCPPVDPTGAALAVPIVRFDGEFRVNGVAPPKSEYDDANLWLENTSTHDRVALGNSHDGSFAVRVTPGLYEVVYEVETPGAVMPHNPRIVLTKLALFEPTTRDIEIPVASLGGAFTLDGVAPPVSEYDDANVYFRDHVGQVEVLAGNTHDGSWTVNLVPASYDVVYRVETPGPITPRNDGAVLQTLEVTSSVEVLPLAILSAPVTGSFLIAGAPAPQSEYDDANLWLESDLGGRVALGNSHDQTFAMRVIPGAYAAVYAHETGVNVPRNQQAVFAAVAVGQDGADLALDVPMVALSGALTINGVAAPASEYDDGVVSLHGIDSDDVLVLGNTHDQSYAVNLIPGTYELVYAHETAGGTVPQNTRASLGQLVVGAPVGGHDVDVSAVPVAGNFTVGGEAPPNSVYEDGRIYLRNTSTGDAVLLGNTRDGNFDAMVVPGEYRAFYTQETGGALVPSNQNASLGEVPIVGASNFDLDVPVVALSGEFTLFDGPVPTDANDGGQLYLRASEGDSVLLGDSFATDFAVKLVAGTYGVYYRSQASVTMPENENGRFACITVE